MWCTIILAVLVALTQFCNSWLGWRMTLNTEPLSPRKRKLYNWMFVLFGLFGVICVGILAYRSYREHAHLTVTRIEKAYIPNPFVINEPLRANVWVKNVGKGPGRITSHYSRTYIREDVEITSQQSAVAEFRRWMEANPPKSSGEFLPPEQPFWFTSDGAVLSPEDYQNLINGRRVFYVLSDVRFTDDFGTHEFQNCQMLQPLRRNELSVFAYCKVFNDEIRRFL